MRFTFYGLTLITMSTTDFTREDTQDPEVPLYCANHPNEETYVRCSRCEKPICARCRVRTPVGFRCFDCARLQVLPTYAVSADYYARAAVFGFAAAAVAGALMGLFPAFEFWAALLMGIAIPEGVAFGANQKRGPGLQMVAIAAVVFGFALSRVVLIAFPLLDSLPGHITQYTILWLALALFLAYRRLQ